MILSYILTSSATTALATLLHVRVGCARYLSFVTPTVTTVAQAKERSRRHSKRQSRDRTSLDFASGGKRKPRVGSTAPALLSCRYCSRHKPVFFCSPARTVFWPVSLTMSYFSCRACSGPGNLHRTRPSGIFFPKGSFVLLSSCYRGASTRTRTMFSRFVHT